MNIGQRIKQARLAHKPKMTQKQLAEAVDVSCPAVTQWESGEKKMLAGDNLVRAARALGVTTEWLLYGTGPGPGELRAEKKNPLGLDEETLLMAQAFQSLSSTNRAVVRTVIDSLRAGRPERCRVRK